MPLQSVEKLFLQECCKYPDTAFQYLLVLRPSSTGEQSDKKEAVDREYSQQIQCLENQTHNTTSIYPTESTTTTFTLPHFFPSDSSPCPEDLQDTFFSSLNKFISASVVRELCSWAYKLTQGGWDRRIVLPEEAEQLRQHARRELNRQVMAQAAVSLFLSDYKVVLNAAELFFKAAEKAKKDPFLEAACNEGKCCCLLCNFLENPSNATHLVTMTMEVTRLLNEAISHYLKGNYTALAIATALKLARFYMSLLTCVEQFHYPQLALDLLDLSPNETDTAEDPSAFFTHYLRQRVLDALAHCDALMAAQAEGLRPPLLHCVAICQTLGFRRKQAYFLDRLGQFEESQHHWSFCYATYHQLIQSFYPSPSDALMIHIPQTTEGHSTHLRIVPRDSLKTNPHSNHRFASWSSVAYHVLHDMAECVRVLGLTDLRIEHVLLLLNCYSRYGVETEEAVVRQLLGELCDVSSEIEDYCSHAALPVRLTALSTACLDPGSIIHQRSLAVDKTFMFVPSFKTRSIGSAGSTGSTGSAEPKKEVWVLGETYRVEVTLQNPLPAPVTVSAIEVLTASSTLRCISARSTVLPAHASTTTHLFVIPTACGEMRFTGLRVQIGHVRSHVIAAALPPIHILVIPSFPQLPVTLSSIPPPLLFGETHAVTLSLRCLKEKVEDVTLQLKLVLGEKEQEQWVFRGEKPGSCVTSTIRFRREDMASTSSLKLVSFPITAGNCAPSFIAYDPSHISRIQSQFPLRPNSCTELPFLLFLTTPLSVCLLLLTSSELHVDVTFSVAADSVYTRVASYTHQFVSEDFALRAADASVAVSLPLAGHTSPLLTQLRSYRQESDAATCSLRCSLACPLAASLFVFVPQRLLPPTTRFTRVTVTSKTGTPPFELLAVKSGLADNTQLAFDPARLTTLQGLWRQSGHRGEETFVLAQHGFFPAHTAMRLVLELNRHVGIPTSEVMQNVLVFWSADREKKYGYLPLRQLLQQSKQLSQQLSQQFSQQLSQQQSQQSLPEDMFAEKETTKFTEFVLRDEKGESVKGSVRGRLKHYRVKRGSLVKGVFGVKDCTKTGDWLHQM
ncbi:hypothetical protein WA556_006973 [Blastocystis sp. ATCC 50177/Nand II]